MGWTLSFTCSLVTLFVAVSATLKLKMKPALYCPVTNHNPWKICVVLLTTGPFQNLLQWAASIFEAIQVLFGADDMRLVGALAICLQRLPYF